MVDESLPFQDLMEMMKRIQEDTSQNKEELMTGVRNSLEVLKVEINTKVENLLEDKIRVQSEELVASNKLIIKLNPYDGKASWEEYFTQFNK